MTSKWSSWAAGDLLTLDEVAGTELSRRLTGIFLRNSGETATCHGNSERFRSDPTGKTSSCCYEYFHGDTGAGLGASHQTGWTSLVQKCFSKAAKQTSADDCCTNEMSTPLINRLISLF